ncbi:hypothetical protein CXG81DRAFT_20697 [Caulochytrium protostelioides]|uniref:Protein kinase domain-containing protein n=1 Tax=Caulochytrium protostelioides TaxID=1555241 RepID=A0A4P9X293_9FUNG|nr:hypothetical protein CXG81DRAFT_20697 [Caulochytrium protostelioides]|eukprot:RKO99188.1 hypothetical protein CXG81DRAFT_20697 [Caulochytrium protostelioides]
MTKRYAFEARSMQQLICHVKTGHHGPLPNTCPRLVRQLIAALLKPAPRERPHAGQIHRAVHKVLDALAATRSTPPGPSPDRGLPYAVGHPVIVGLPPCPRRLPNPAPRVRAPAISIAAVSLNPSPLHGASPPPARAARHRPPRRSSNGPAQTRSRSRSRSRSPPRPRFSTRGDARFSPSQPLAPSRAAADGGVRPAESAAVSHRCAGPGAGAPRASDPCASDDPSSRQPSACRRPIDEERKVMVQAGVDLPALDDPAPPYSPPLDGRIVAAPSVYHRLETIRDGVEKALGATRFDRLYSQARDHVSLQTQTPEAAWVVQQFGQAP